jgi:hypothetical protein
MSDEAKLTRIRRTLRQLLPQRKTRRAIRLRRPTTKQQPHRVRLTPPRSQQISQRIRKRIEEPFGWTETVGGGRKLRYIGRMKTRVWFLTTGAVYNVIRITALDAQPG